MSSPPVKVAKIDKPTLSRVSGSSNSQDYVISYTSSSANRSQEYSSNTRPVDYAPSSVRTQQDYVSAARSAVVQPQYFRPSQMMDYTFAASPAVYATQNSGTVGLQDLTALPSQYFSQLPQFNTAAQYPPTMSQYPAPVPAPPSGVRYSGIDYTQFQPGQFVMATNYSAILASMGSHAQQVQGHKILSGTGAGIQQTVSSAFSPSESCNLHRQSNDSSTIHRHTETSANQHRPTIEQPGLRHDTQTTIQHRHNATAMVADKHGQPVITDSPQLQQQNTDLIPLLSHEGQQRFASAATMGQQVGLGLVSMASDIVSPDQPRGELKTCSADYIDSYRELKERGHDKLPAKMQAKLSSAQERAARHSPHLSGKQGASPTPDYVSANKYDTHRPPGGDCDEFLIRVNTPESNATAVIVEPSHGPNTFTRTHSPWAPAAIRPHLSPPSTKHNPTLLHQGQQSIQPPHGAPNFLPHFKKGSMIQLASGDLKKIEDMKTEDFVSSVKQRDDLKIDSSTVVRIEELPQTGMAMLHFSIEEYTTQVKVEAALEHPFFVFGQGWSSVNPVKTMYRYSLPCHALKVGDICISLSNKHKNGTTSPDVSGLPVSKQEPTVYIQSSLTIQGQSSPGTGEETLLLSGPKQPIELRPLSIHDPHRSAFQPQVPNIMQMVQSRTCKPPVDEPPIETNMLPVTVEGDSVGTESRPTRKRRWSCPDYPSSRDGEEATPSPKQQQP